MKLLIDKLPELKSKLVEINSRRPRFVKYADLNAYELDLTDYMDNVRALGITIQEAEKQEVYQRALDLLDA